MPPPSKNVVFDVVGTCVSFDAYYAAISRTLGSQLLAQNITPQHFGFTWQTAAELEFTFLSISERYTPYKDVMRAVFYRALFLAGIPEPRGFATDEQRDACMQGYASLELREGCRECFELLRKEGFTVWCFTTGDIGRVKGYFEKAGVEMPKENFVTCDTRGVAKPALAAYREVLGKFGTEEKPWFAAAHMWDVSAAVKAGFRGAYCTVYEREPCWEIFGGEGVMEVVSGSLEGMAEGIIKASSAS